MPTNMSAAEAGAAVDKSAPQPGASKPSGSKERIDWLFRDALRRQQVHPLMDLVRRFRDKDAP